MVIGSYELIPGVPYFAGLPRTSAGHVHLHRLIAGARTFESAFGGTACADEVVRTRWQFPNLGHTAVSGECRSL